MMDIENCGKGDKEMKKEGKRISRLKPDGKFQRVTYLRKMAEQGWILEDMSHLAYTFREDEPQYLRYRMETLEQALSEKDRTDYAKEGWQEVCHDELEYVFAKERDPFDDTPDVKQEEVIEEIDQKIAQIKKNRKTNLLSFLGMILISFFVLAIRLGRDAMDGGALVSFLIRFGPNVLILIGAGWLSTRKLRRRKEQVLDGDIPEEYTDWRGHRRGFNLLVIGIVILMVIWVVCEAQSSPF